MANLLVRKVDDELVRRLKARAQAHGRSAEAEHRAILEEALRPARTGAELWASLVAAGRGLDLDIDDPALHQTVPDVDPFE
jgi:plasmid stability protein